MGSGRRWQRLPQRRTSWEERPGVPAIIHPLSPFPPLPSPPIHIKQCGEARGHGQKRFVL